MPKVSILLSSYNHADYIGESIQSILDQTFEDFELYVIDDCSTDDSWKVIKQFKDPRIIAIRNKKNLGVVVRPEIVEKLKGEYMAMAHCDDKWESTKLEKQVEFLDTHQDYAACFTLVKLIDDSGEEFKEESHPIYGIFKQKNRTRLEWLQQFFYRGNVLCHPSVLLRLSVQKEYALYAVGLASLPDEYRWIKICLHHNIFVYPEELTDFRVRNMDENTSGDRLDNKLRYNFESFVLLNLFKETFDYKKDDFLRIYPSAKKYFIDGDNDVEYIFARTLIDIENHQYQLYGMKLLWEIMQEPDRRLSLKSRYGFTNKDFVALSGSIDCFNFLAGKSTMFSTLYYDTGKGFNENDKLTQKVYVNDRDVFRVSFDLSKIKHIYNLRFDPFENACMKVKDVIITIDSKEVDYTISGHIDLGDGYIEFTDSDPQFMMNNCAGKNLVVRGLIKPISYDEIGEKMQKLQVLAQETCFERLKRYFKKGGRGV